MWDSVAVDHPNGVDIDHQARNHATTAKTLRARPNRGRFVGTITPFLVGAARRARLRHSRPQARGAEVHETPVLKRCT